MTNTYDVGDKVTITGTFKQSGSETDPAAVHGHFKGPSDSAQTDYIYGTDAELTKSSTGVYTFDISIDEKGEWWYRMDDNDTNVATEGFFFVRDPQFT